MEYFEIKENQIMRKCDLLKGIYYAGYYDEDGNFNINISKEDAEEVLARLTGAKVTISK